MLQKELNFTVKYIKPKDGFWSTPDGHGGMIGVLRRNEADLCTASLSQTPERAQWVDFSTPIMEDILTITMLKTKGVSQI